MSELPKTEEGISLFNQVVDMVDRGKSALHQALVDSGKESDPKAWNAVQSKNSQMQVAFWQWFNLPEDHKAKCYDVLHEELMALIKQLKHELSA